MIEVHGYIKDLIAKEEYRDFIKNIENPDEFLISAIDAPIIRNGKVIGVINDVDLDDGIIYGVFWGYIAIEVDVCNERIASVQLV